MKIKSPILPIQAIGVDLFSGAGGMSLGAKWAGVDTVVALDSDPNAANTYEANLCPRLGFIRGDIRQVDPTQFINSYSYPVILYGGPPCQGFSTSNQKTRTRSNPNNWLFCEFLRITEAIKPDAVVFENVRGLKETEGGSFFEQILKHFKSIGYYTEWSILNAADFGVPQNRQRLFIIGTKKKSRNSVFEIIKKSQKLAHITVSEAIMDLPSLENGAQIDWLPYSQIPPSDYAVKMRNDLSGCGNHLVSKNSAGVLERYHHIPPGGNWENIPSEMMNNYKDRTRCHTGIYHRLYPEKPSIVIGNFRKNMLIHPTEHRGLSIREAARIQSFPDWYDFKGSIGFQQQQVGNAVPPLLAKAVFDAVLGSLSL
jgi:DNA (cytosine-5)-methyltransferase 1